jgi:SAM-dependent methyltransferase
MNANLISPTRVVDWRRNDYRHASDNDAFVLNILRSWIEQTLTATLKSLAPHDRCVIDVGCGNQPFRPFIERLGADYCSFDVVQNATESVDHIAPLDAENLPPGLHGSSFNLVLCTEVLEHVYDWRAAFANLYRLTRPGGVVILTCPFFWPLHEQPHDFWRPTTFAIRHAAEAAGFTVAQEKLGGGIWDVIGTALGHARISCPALGVLGPPFALAASVIKRLIVMLLRRGWVQRFVRMECVHSPFYLSNLFVLRRGPATVLMT